MSSKIPRVPSPTDSVPEPLEVLDAAAAEFEIPMAALLEGLLAVLSGEAEVEEEPEGT
ncbi:MAG: hypothetical protein DVB28_000249 [Verrucomicrobia bacterium]|nr:MAG: hypothetical protein DVB28_000249 [Verrucomicrobiota bacterium]